MNTKILRFQCKDDSNTICLIKDALSNLGKGGPAVLTSLST